jgi:hypothetical protein
MRLDSTASNNSSLLSIQKFKALAFEMKGDLPSGYLHGWCRRLPLMCLREKWRVPLSGLAVDRGSGAGG